MYWITVIVSFVIAVLSGMGLGSAGLLVAYLTAVVGTPQITAQGINLLFFLFAAGAALCVRLSRQSVRFLPLFTVILAGMMGVIPGALTAGILPEKWIRILFGIMLIAAGLRSLVGIVTKKKRKNGKSV